MVDTDESLGELDRNIDEEVLDTIRQSKVRLRESQLRREPVTAIELVQAQHRAFGVIADSMPDESVLRRLLTLVLPLVGDSTRVRS